MYKFLIHSCFSLLPLLALNTWAAPMSLYMEKLEDMKSFLLRMDVLEQLAAFLIILGGVRLTMYLRVHPHVALVYNTLERSFADLFHFILVFSFMLIFMAIYANWVLGPDYAEFGTQFSALYTQYRMVIGDFPFREDVSFITIYCREKKDAVSRSEVEWTSHYSTDIANPTRKF